MKRFFCNGKKGYCDRENDNIINCFACEFADDTGGEIVECPDTVYEAITEQVNKTINTIFQREINNEYSDTGNEISQAVKDIVYSHKDEIIDKVVDRAVIEIVRKGIPKLLERAGV